MVTDGEWGRAALTRRMSQICDSAISSLGTLEIPGFSTMYLGFVDA
jgi:hypothetical protein